MIGMLHPFVVAPGLIFDGRSVMISLSGLFFGPIAAMTAGTMALVLRILQGGEGALMGVLAIIASVLFMADVNGLKLINDSFGHAEGDKLLKKVAEVMTKGCRADEIIARLGGDEFVILLPKTDASETERMIKRVKNLASNEESILNKPGKLTDGEWEEIPLQSRIIAVADT